MMNEPVSTIMTHNPVSLSPENTLSDVQNIFMSNRIHHLPIVEDGKLVGLITTYDLWKNNASFDSYKKVKIRDVMNTRIAKITKDDKVGTAAELFLDKRFHALPVVDGDQLVGIVTSFDVLRYEFKKEYSKAILYADVLNRRVRPYA